MLCWSSIPPPLSSRSLTGQETRLGDQIRLQGRGDCVLPREIRSYRYHWPWTSVLSSPHRQLYTALLYRLVYRPVYRPLYTTLHALPRQCRPSINLCSARHSRSLISPGMTSHLRRPPRRRQTGGNTPWRQSWCTPSTRTSTMLLPCQYTRYVFSSIALNHPPPPAANKELS